MDEGRYLSCLDQIYTAALDRTRWPVFLDTLRHLFDCDSSVIFLQDMRSAEVGFLQNVGQEPAALVAYRDHFSKLNLWLDKTRDLPPGSLAHSAEILDDAVYRRSEFYNDWLKPQGLYYALGSTVLRTPAADTDVSILRPHRAGAFTALEQQHFARLMTHVRRAIEIHRRLQGAALLQQGLWQRLGRLSLAVAVVDGDCRLLFANPAAERLLDQGDGVGVRDGRLTAASPAETQALQRGVAAAVAPDAADAAGTDVVLKLRRRFRRPLAVLIGRLAPAEAALPFSAPAALLFIHTPRNELNFDACDLAALYGLTSAEAKLLRALLLGQRLAEYAEVADISLNTAKSYLRDIFAKTGTDRQAELLRRVLANPVLQLASR
jgi:DNA-binding CsgD family transcriptional regulator